MNKIRPVQSVFFALIMLALVTMGTSAFAESENMIVEHPNDEKTYKENIDRHKKEYMAAMAGGYERSLNITKDINSYMKILSTEYQKIMVEFSNDSLDSREKYDIQRQFIENAKSIQMAWLVPFN